MCTRGIINIMGYKNLKFIVYNHLIKFSEVTRFITFIMENPANTFTQQKNISVPELNGVNLIGVYNENSY